MRSSSRSGFCGKGEAQQVIQAQGTRNSDCSIALGRQKEAYLKGRGVGLSLGLDRFEILFDDGSPLAHVRMTDSGALDTNWQVQSLSLADDVSGALAVEGQALAGSNV